MNDSLYSANDAFGNWSINEQVAHQIFEILPLAGPVMLIMDTEGVCWPSDPDEFAKTNISESFLREICVNIDDGSEPVVTQLDELSIVACQLATERTNLGYVVIILPEYSPEATLVNIDLIEIVLNQVGLIANLIEKNNNLYELQIKQHSLSFQSQSALN